MAAYYYKLMRFLGKGLDLVPGKSVIGEYRLLPVFFCAGATLEFLMIKWKPFPEVNFYKVYIRKQKLILDEQFEQYKSKYETKD